MNILIVTGIFPPDIGGPATWVPAIAEFLQRRGNTVSVLTLADDPDGVVESYPFGVVKVRRSQPLWRRLPKTIATIIRAGRNADCIVCNGLYEEAALANLVLRKPLVAKVVGDSVWERATNRGETSASFIEFQSSRVSPAITIHRWLRNQAIRLADRVIVPSRFLKGIVEGWGIQEARVKVVYNGISESSEACDVKTLLATPHTIITVGRLTKWKGIAELIGALEDISDIGLIIVGDGPEEARLKERAATSAANNRIFFAGRRSKPEIRSLMAQSDLFVLNSSYEGLPHVLLEALSAGMPIVATNAGGSPEVITPGITGTIVQFGDSAELKSAIQDALSRDPFSPAFEKEAKATLERMSALNMYEQTANLIESIA